MGNEDTRTPTATSHFIDLQQQVKQFWELEDVGREDTPLSIMERRVEREWDRTTEVVDGHYVLGIPFKYGLGQCMPNNRAMAEHRLVSLGKRLARDDTLREMYTTQITDLLSKGYAEPVSDPDRMDVNYIPHHAVTHPKKPGKVRVVFDCAAKHQGVSLNDKVHQGPDVTNKLVGVLQR